MSGLRARVAAGVALTVVLLCRAGPAAEIRSLFTDAPGPAAAAAGGPAKRLRNVRLDMSLFTAAGSPLARLPGSLRLRLFDDADYTVVFDRTQAVGSGGRGWVGHLKGADGGRIPGSFVTLSHRRGAVAGSVRVPGRGSFRIGSAGKGVHVVWEHDPAKASKKLPPRRHPVAASAKKATSRRALPKAGDSVIDIMVVYTDAAETAANGGVPGNSGPIEADIIDAVLLLNDTFVNSQVDVEANLVHMEKVTYDETTAVPNPPSQPTEFHVHLDRLTWTADGVMDNVHALRNTWGADLVCLWVRDSSGLAGLAWEPYGPSMNPPNGDSPAEFAPWAFGVVELWSAALPTAAFPHETGHNLGCGHEPSLAGGFYADSKAHDFGNPSVSPNTMMIAAGACVPYFSNPGVIYPGNGQPSGVLNVSNNARALQYTVPNVITPIRANVWPEVTIDAPTEGATVQLGFPTSITATVSDLDGTVTSVTFYVDGSPIGSDLDGVAPWTFDWTPSSAGAHVLSAVAGDDTGLFTPPAAQPQVNVTVVPDDDNDGLPNWWEQFYSALHGTGPTILNYLDSDSDSDGTPDGDDDDDGDTLTNMDEYLLGTDPILADTDGDGLDDDEEQTYSTDPLNPDSDFDLMPDGWEVANLLDPLVDDAGDDAEGDGMSNLEEYVMGTDPNVSDSDGDGLPDAWEFLYYDPSPPEWLDPALIDSDTVPPNDDGEDHDGDLLTNAEEFAAGTNPILADTDGDGLDDGEELASSTDPTDWDSDDDLMPDGWEVDNLLDPLFDDADLDADGDGFTNYREYSCGSDPQDAASIPPAGGGSGCGPAGGGGGPGLLLALLAAALVLKSGERRRGTCRS